jgi:hypothetical protein
VVAQSTATIKATGCLVQSDSDVVVTNGARISADAVRAVSSATAPCPVTDGPPIAEPFASLSINVPARAMTDRQVHGTRPLKAGVHCEAMKIAGNSKLVLGPGEHYL